MDENNSMKNTSSIQRSVILKPSGPFLFFFSIVLFFFLFFYPCRLVLLPPLRTFNRDSGRLHSTQLGPSSFHLHLFFSHFPFPFLPFLFLPLLAFHWLFFGSTPSFHYIGTTPTFSSLFSLSHSHSPTIHNQNALAEREKNLPDNTSYRLILGLFLAGFP